MIGSCKFALLLAAAAAIGFCQAAGLSRAVPTMEHRKASECPPFFQDEEGNTYFYSEGLCPQPIFLRLEPGVPSDFFQQFRPDGKRFVKNYGKPSTFTVASAENCEPVLTSSYAFTIQNGGTFLEEEVEGDFDENFQTVIYGKGLVIIGPSDEIEATPEFENGNFYFIRGRFEYNFGFSISDAGVQSLLTTTSFSGVSVNLCEQIP